MNNKTIPIQNDLSFLALDASCLETSKATIPPINKHPFCARDHCVENSEGSSVHLNKCY